MAKLLKNAETARLGKAETKGSRKKRQNIRLKTRRTRCCLN